MASIYRMNVVMQDLIRYAKSCGGDITRLCNACGLPRRRYNRWNEESEELIERVLKYEEKAGGQYLFTEEEKLLAIFYSKVVMEVARAEIHQLEKVILDQDWRSGAWYLERTNPNFAKRRDIANADEFLKFVQRYYGIDSREAMEYVWTAIQKGKEALMNYDEQEAEIVNTNRRIATADSGVDES